MTIYTLSRIGRVVAWLALICIMVALWMFALAWLEANETAREAPTHGFTVTIPACEEDEGYLQGYGDFDGDVWEHYRCIHNDNIVLIGNALTIRNNGNGGSHA